MDQQMNYSTDCPCLSVKLNDGNRVPAVGFGVWLSEPQQVGAAVETAIRAGYRHIDTAMMYENVKEVGNSLQKVFKEGVVARENLYVASKLMMTYMNSKEDVFECCDITLRELKIEYLDLFVVHHPIALKKNVDYRKLTKDKKYSYDEAIIATVWNAMEKLVEMGKVKSIGISNFTITKTEKLLKTASIIPAVNEVECHLYFQQPKLREYLNSKGIAVQVFAPLGSPRGRYWMINNSLVHVAPVLEDPILCRIAFNHHATPAQVCISFLLHLGLVVLPKSAKESRLIENLKASQIHLNESELTELKKLDKSQRLFKLNEFYYINEEDFWDVKEDESYSLTN